MKVEETVPAALDGERIDRVVSLIADISRSDATKLIADGGTEIDGSVVTSGKSRLKEGQTVVVDLDKIPVPVLPGPDASVVLGCCLCR
jgi:23S rRNA pseudouridine1911/1915/1917 synthase